MSEIEVQLEQMAQQAQNEVQRLMERGNYYKEREDYSQALLNYINALQAYAEFAKRKSNVISVSVAISTRDVNPGGAYLVFSRTLFDLSYLLKFIADSCRSDSIIKAYANSRILQISEKLDEYERVFNKEDLETYGSIKQYVQSAEYSIRQNQNRLSSLQPIKEESNKGLKGIRQALADISSEKVCPLTLEESGGCFIATAVYSDYFHQDLDTFRWFRDDVLMRSHLGRFFVKVYYKIGPKIAQSVSQNGYIKKILRVGLEHLAVLMRNCQ